MSEKAKAKAVAKKMFTSNEAMSRWMTSNASLLRSELLQTLLDPRRSIDTECGYPERIELKHYNKVWEREGLGKRVVGCLPAESWAVPPEIYEVEDEDVETEFEKAWKELEGAKSLFAIMQRADELSGIGRFGVILLGLSDGKTLDQEVVGKNLKLNYVRVFDETVVTVSKMETDQSNPRYGLPIEYNITFTDQTGGDMGSQEYGMTTTNANTVKVHWTRIIHVADNRRMSEIYGEPRMKPVYNRLLDVRKVLSGSGEMFWRGAFPGYSFEVNPDQKDVELDATTIREEFNNWSQGLQRYLAVTGVSVKSLAPQVADPLNHLEAQLNYIALTLGIPKRILFGSEEAKLASTQDAKTWKTRLTHRQNSYLTPYLIRPFVDRLIEFGVLPAPAHTTTEVDEPEEVEEEPKLRPSTNAEETETRPKYTVEWPDMFAMSEEDMAKVSESKTKALASYVSGGVETLITPMEFLTKIMHMSQEEAEAIVEAAKEREEEMAVEQEEEQAMLEEEAKRQGLVKEVPGFINPDLPPAPGKKGMPVVKKVGASQSPGTKPGGKPIA